MTSPTTEDHRSDKRQVSVLGIRHFGPGSARATLAALEALHPDTVLVEGPADADGIVHWAGAPGMVPPVALLGYEVANPGNASFWPMAAFCAEWQAICWALNHRVPVRFIDLPSAVTLADRRGRPLPDDDAKHAVDDPRPDPLAQLAAAAGFDDTDSWWDHLIESRADTGDHESHPMAAFDELSTTIAQLRVLTGPDPDPLRAHYEARREAHMRTVLRAVLKAGARRVVVVCGAWHAPALTTPLPPATADAALLRRLPKLRTQVAWVPWSHERLCAAGGYGAGVASPGWYHHLFTAPDHVTQRWLTRVAGVLRTRDLPVSPASVIEACRLASTLADLRRRPSVGLAEVQQATVAVLCGGDATLASYVTRDAVIGHALGSVPEQAPNPPLETDLLATARRLRLRREPATRELVLDLRGDTDLGRSHLLHRLDVLGIAWGVRRATTGIGTFKEGWALRWHPELSVDVVVAATYGPTVADAAAALLTRAAQEATTLAQVTTALERALLTDLPQTVPAILQRLSDRAAAEQDVLALLSAIPALARALRYGDVRGTDTGALRASAASLLDRALAGLPPAVSGINTDVANEFRDHLDRVHEATALIGAETRARWLDRLDIVAHGRHAHPLLAGRAVRILHGVGRLDSAGAATALHAALSVGTPALDQAAWVEGFLAREGLLLAHDRTLLALLDDWVLGLSEQDFRQALPLLRRTFGGYAAPERRAVGDHVRRLHRPADAAQSNKPVGGFDEGFDPTLAAGPVATIALVLGLDQRLRQRP